MPSNTSPSLNINQDIPHIRQRFNWDCGIACVLMLLSNEQRNNVLENFTRLCLEEGFGHSTWTIDLCYLLKRFNIKHVMYTSRQAANNRAYSNEEADRVRSRFENASYNGIRVIDGAISMKQLVAHIATTGPAIVLVEASLLSCDWCKYNKLTSEFRRIFGGGYQGHYIIIVGWTAGKLLYRNPARPRPLCATSFKRLQAARLSPGTDGDIVLIYNSHR